MKKYFTLVLMVLALMSQLPGTASAQNSSDLEKERISQSGVAIHIIFDDSGSMNDNGKIQQAKEAFFQWLQGIPSTTKLSLRTLNRGVLVPLAPNNKEQVKNTVTQLGVGGGTPLAKTIWAEAKDIADRRKTVTPYERHIVVIFTDGEDTDVSASEVQKTIRNLGNATIETVGIGFHGQGDYMKGAATQYYNAGDSEELLKALQQVASEIDQQSDLVISPEIQAAMEKVPTNNRPQAQAETIAPAPKGGLSVGAIVIIGIVVVLAIILIGTWLAD